MTPVGGGEPRLEDQALKRHGVGTVRFLEETECPGPLGDAAEGEPRPVILDLDHDGPGLAEGPEPDEAAAILAAGDPFPRRLDPVGKGVAHQVGEGVSDLLDDLRIDLDVFPLDGQARRLAESGGKVARRYGRSV